MTCNPLGLVRRPEVAPRGAQLRCLSHRLMLAKSRLFVAILLASVGMVLLAPAATHTATAACLSGATMNVVAHEDDDLLFLSPDLLHDIQSGRCVRTVYVTAGDADNEADYWMSRESGMKAAYAQMAGVANSWSTADAGVSGHPIPLLTLTGRPSVSLEFMRLPDGNGDGSGYPNNNFESLQKLWQASISQIHAVNGSSAYTKSGLTSTLTTLMSSLQPDTVRTQDYVDAFGDVDHSDHIATAYFTRAAHQGYTTPHQLIGYMDYATNDLAQNVFDPDLTAKRNAFNSYLGFDEAPCGSPPNCGNNDYAGWIKRQYTVGSESGGTGGNSPPVANAGPDQSVSTGSSVTLDGSGSSDPNGDPLTYQWTQTGGTPVTLSSATAQKPTFTAPAAATTLVFSLVVNDGTLNSPADTVSITVGSVANSPPVANAGPDRSVSTGSSVTLDGSGSSDPNGDPLTYQWTQTGGTPVTLSSATAQKPTFTAPAAATTLVFSLVVNDGTLNSPADTVSISVVGQSGCPCSIWAPSATPQVAAEPDSTAYELGVRFQSDVAGYISGIRFYKGTGNTGTHLGHLWTSTGTQLASATFTNETATGWQQVNFATPVAIAANTTYVASFFAPAGHFALDRPYFTAARDNPPLHALADGAGGGGNGVYRDGSSGFPTDSVGSSNYWVDVVFTTSTGGTTDTTPPTSTVSFPAVSGSYDASGWNAGCPAPGFCGTASDAGSGVQKVELSIRQGSGNYWNGTAFSSSTEVFVSAAGTSSWSYGFPAAGFPGGGQYTVRVRATDNSGNVESASSRTFTLSTSSQPVVGISFPAAGASYRAATWASGCAAAGFCGTASDVGSGIQKVELSIRQASGNFYWDGIAFTSASEVFVTAAGTSSWSYAFPAASFPSDGQYIVTVRATNNAGNTTDPSARTFTLDMVAAGSSVTFPTAAAAYRAATWNVGCATAGFCGTATDATSGVQGVQLSIRRGTGNYWNGTSFGSPSEVWVSATGTTSWTYPFAASLFPASTNYTIRVRATDNVGNVQTPSSATFSYDTANPSSAVTFPVANASYTTASWNTGCPTPGICGTASDALSGVAKVEISIRRGSANYWNGTAFASTSEVFLTATGTTAWSFAFPASNFPAAANYTIRLRATDKAGNVQSPSSRKISFTP
jgi:LmbE family N-acetylglucosaminyl deacetylase